MNGLFFFSSIRKLRIPARISFFDSYVSLSLSLRLSTTTCVCDVRRRQRFTLTSILLSIQRAFSLSDFHFLDFVVLIDFFLGQSNDVLEEEGRRELWLNGYALFNELQSSVYLTFGGKHE